MFSVACCSSFEILTHSVFSVYQADSEEDVEEHPQEQR